MPRFLNANSRLILVAIEILTGEVPLGHIEYVDFIQLVVRMDVRPERPGDNDSSEISDSLWSLAEICWAKDPQRRPTALTACDTIHGLLPIPRLKVPLSPRGNGATSAVPATDGSHSTSVSLDNSTVPSSPESSAPSPAEIISAIFDSGNAGAGSKWAPESYPRIADRWPTCKCR
jgi:copper chaperone CopZ